MKLKFGIKTNQVFKLLSLELWNHPILGDINLNFVDENELNFGPYSTVIIGPNGTGKSSILRLITDVFREIESLTLRSKNQELVKCGYKISYYNYGNTFTYTNRKRKELYQLTKNGELIKPDEIQLPSSIIATSIMLNDRFYVPVDYKGKIYEYLGVRRIKTPSVAGTQTVTRNLVNLILENVEDKTFIKHLEEILNLLGYRKELRMIFYPRYRNKIFTGEINDKQLYDFFINWEKVLIRRKTPPYGYNYFKKHFSKDKEKIKKLSSYINSLTQNYKLNKRGKFISLSIYDSSLITRFRKHFRTLGSLDLLTAYNFSFLKKEEIPVAETSSGEYHFFVSLVGIAAVIKQNSLVLLDEPDISLHPNWQMRYISFLKEIFSKYKSCHFIMATHSHFLVSDLEPSSSSLIALKKDDDNVINREDIPKETFGWSAENILYRVFNVRSVRNYYFEIQLSKLLSLISQDSEDLEEIKLLVNNVSKYRIDKLDPLNEIINQVQQYIQSK